MVGRSIVGLAKPCCSHQSEMILASRQMITPLSSLSIKFSLVMVDMFMILLSQSARSSLRGVRQACCSLIILAAYSSALATASRASLRSSSSWSSWPSRWSSCCLTSGRPLPTAGSSSDWHWCECSWILLSIWAGRWPVARSRQPGAPPSSWLPPIIASWLAWRLKWVGVGASFWTCLLGAGGEVVLVDQ